MPDETNPALTGTAIAAIPDNHPVVSDNLYVGLGGVTSATLVGGVAASTIAATTPSVDTPPNAEVATTNVDSDPQPAGTAPTETTETATTPGATPENGLAVTDAGTAAAAATKMAVVKANLNAIEQLALYWGGETGVKIRNHVGRIREELQ